MKNYTDTIKLIYTPKEDMELELFNVLFGPKGISACSIHCALSNDINNVHSNYLHKGFEYVITYNIYSMK